MDVDGFIARWTARDGGAERANYQMFLSELCDVLGVARPDPAGSERDRNDYVFERAVRPRLSEDSTVPKRIDLYKKGAFILEAKQSRLPGKKNAIPGQPSLFEAEPEHLGKPTARRGWDVMMQNARKQAEGYVFLLDADQPAPPFIIVCDVGHCLEIYADFSGTGRAYDQFPDRKGFRLYLDDLHRPEVREMLAAIWTDPHSLDPTRRSARVTREIARRLAEVSKALEEKDCNAEDVAHFLMRCLFTMFAEDTDLLPRGSFRALLEKSVDDPAHFPVRLKALWKDMEAGSEFSHVIEARVRHFNGGLFKDTTAFELGRKELHEQIDALTFQAYGWPADLSNEQILERLVALNAERAEEEAAGHVRWLRPDYQIPRFAKGAAARTGELDLGEAVIAIDKALPVFPTDRYEQPLAVEAVLAAAGRPMTAAELARGFKRGGKRIEHRIAQVLTTLVRYGRASALPNETFSARRAA